MSLSAAASAACVALMAVDWRAKPPKHASASVPSQPLPKLVSAGSNLGWLARSSTEMPCTDGGVSSNRPPPLLTRSLACGAPGVIVVEVDQREVDWRCKRADCKPD